MNIKGLTVAFNRQFNLDVTEGAIKAALHNHKIRCGRKPGERLIDRNRMFTEEQERFIREAYRHHTVVETARLLNEKYGLEVTGEQIKSYAARNGVLSGRTGRFSKGHQPWNSGTRGQGLTGANKGSFKKGTVPPNRKPLGSERVCSKDGFILVKVAEKNPYTGFPTRYKHKHIHMWEEAHGAVPDGMVVAFRDGNKLNCALENLMLISRAELLNLNRHGYRTVPDELKPTVLAMSTLQVKAWEREKEA